MIIISWVSSDYHTATSISDSKSTWGPHFDNIMKIMTDVQRGVVQLVIITIAVLISSSMGGGCDKKTRSWRRGDVVADYCRVFCRAVCEVWRVYCVPDHQNTHHTCGRYRSPARETSSAGNFGFRFLKIFPSLVLCSLYGSICICDMKDLSQHACNDCTAASCVSDYCLFYIAFCCLEATRFLHGVVATNPYL